MNFAWFIKNSGNIIMLDMMRGVKGPLIALMEKVMM